MPFVPLATYKTPRKVAQSRNNQVGALMAPTNGLNLRDPYLMLAPEDALVLNNFIARPQGCETRAGYRKHVTGLGGSVNSLLGYLAQDPADNRIFAAVDDQFFDVSTSADSPSPDVSNNNSTDGYWSSIMFSGATLNYLCCTSPSGGYWTYDSTNGWVDRTLNLTGFSGDCGPIASWKNRLFIVAEGTAKFYYIQTANAIQGAVSEFDLGPLMKHGGHIVGVVNWTMNAGIDIDDYLVFFGSQGDVIIYAGTDPDDPSTFALKGIWYMARPPVGDRFFHEYGGELFVLSEIGLIPLTKMVNGEVANTYNIISARIQPALSPQLTAYIDNAGWEVGLSDDNDLLIVKPPLMGDVYQQWVMNIQTGAWSTFTGMPMNVWGTYNGQMWFGTADGTVCLGLDGDLDGIGLDGTGGTDIFATLQGGFSDFGSPANLKTFSLVRPIFLAQVNPSVAVQINIDYSPNPIYASPAFTPSNAAVWDAAHWDNAVWAAGESSFAAWAGIQGLGYYGSLKMAVVGKAETKYVSSTIVYQTGGVM